MEGIKLHGLEFALNINNGIPSLKVNIGCNFRNAPIYCFGETHLIQNDEENMKSKEWQKIPQDKYKQKQSMGSELRWCLRQIQ